MLENSVVPPTVTRLKSGPLGGDQQLGALIVEGEVDILIFFLGSDAAAATRCGCKSIVRITVLYNIPTASNRSTADFIVSSSLFHESYCQPLKDYAGYITREVDLT